jgi:hypothetical protein
VIPQLIGVIPRPVAAHDQVLSHRFLPSLQCVTTKSTTGAERDQIWSCTPIDSSSCRSALP